jgi:hypothetical protein
MRRAVGAALLLLASAGVALGQIGGQVSQTGATAENSACIQAFLLDWGITAPFCALWRPSSMAALVHLLSALLQSCSTGGAAGCLTHYPGTDLACWTCIDIEDGNGLTCQPQDIQCTSSGGYNGLCNPETATCEVSGCSSLEEGQPKTGEP